MNFRHRKTVKGLKDAPEEDVTMKQAFLDNQSPIKNALREEDADSNSESSNSLEDVYDIRDIVQNRIGQKQTDGSPSYNHDISNTDGDSPKTN